MRVVPGLDEVLAHSGDETHMALSVELIADGETPVSLYRRLVGEPGPSFLLESAEGGETVGRYSFIGFDPALSFQFADGTGHVRRGQSEETVAFTDPLAIAAELLAGYRVASRPELPRFQGGLVGYLGFDCVRYFERLPAPASEDPAEVPEGCLLLMERLIIVDHLRRRLVLIDHMPLTGDRARAYRDAVARFEAVRARLESPSGLEHPLAELEEADLGETSRMAPSAFHAAVETAKEAIQAGEVFQVVLSQPTTVHEAVASFDVYRALRVINPSPYMFHLRFRDFAVVGASPEVLVRLDGDEILLRPIAGTRPRGRNREEDLALEQTLLSDTKELAEHRMLLDLGRNDAGRVGRVGSVEVDRPLHIERYSHVMHIVSDVRASLRRGLNAFDVLRACFPAGTVSGAPKIRAMELIAELEPTRRGVYAGAVGYFDFTGNMDTCIAIRTLVVRPDRVHVQAGAGIVFDSDAGSEHAECENKARAQLNAVSMAKAMGGRDP